MKFLVKAYSPAPLMEHVLFTSFLYFSLEFIDYFLYSIFIQSTSTKGAKESGMPGTKSNKEKFTAVVYFHGMGEQKRYQEASRLVDSLDRFYRNQNDEEKSISEEIEAKSEISIADETRTVGYISLKHKSKAYRFYEAYWANITADGVKWLEVLTWLLKQTLVPFKAVFASWREMGRLKRSIFLAEWDSIREKKPGENPTEAHVQKLFELFNKYDLPQTRKRFKRGSFRDFLEYIRENSHDRHKDEEETTLLYLARAWRRRYVKNQIISLLVLITLLLAMALVAFALIAFFGAFTSIFDAGTMKTVYGFVEKVIGANAINPKNPVNIFLFALATFVFWYSRYFLRTYMGDVYFWVTYEESSTKHLKRIEILKTCIDSLKQVLLNDDCERIIIVAHSLGTTVAYDTLLELARYDTAGQGSFKDDKPKTNLKLEKIERFITLASPIDKISYFFENQRSTSYQYLRTVDKIRGSIESEPFTYKGGKANKSARQKGTIWYNFWDKADIISASLQGVGGREQAVLNIRNVEVRSFLFPNPASAHLAYFDNRNIIHAIYQAAFTNDKELDTQPFDVNPTRFWQVLLLAAPWLISLYIYVTHPSVGLLNVKWPMIFDSVSSSSIFGQIVFYVVAVVLIALTIFFLISLWIRHFDGLGD